MNFRILTLGIIFALATFAPAADPGWWETRGVKNSSPASNRSPATIGQAKHMAAMALKELEQRLPAAEYLALKSAVDAVANLDVLVIPPGMHPTPPPPGYIGPNNHILLVGQLKTLAKPFYDTVRILDSAWLDAEMATTEIRVVEPGSDPASFSPYPWSVAASDDENKGMASIGQLKAVFSLRFERLPRHADSDSDGWTDSQEVAAGTNPMDPDTDGDGIPDSIDSDPLISAIAFADADGDGIPDGEDAAPNEPRGPAPSIAAENASGNPLSNLIKDEVVKLVVMVSNPASAAPTASNLAFFVNGTAEIESATITAIGSPVASSQRFLLTWAAKTTANYPTITLQNLTIRFRDSEQATSWLKLARIDVAEWEGMIASLRSGTDASIPLLNVFSHFGGKKSISSYEMASHQSRAGWYRGPREISFVDDSSGSTLLTAEIPGTMRYPLFLISASSQGVPVLDGTISISDATTYTHSGYLIVNDCATDIQMELTPGGSATISSGDQGFLARPEPDQGGPSIASRKMHYKKAGNWELFQEGVVGLASATGSNRSFIAGRFYSSAALEGFSRVWMDFLAPVGAQITPHAAGLLEHPGLPLPCEFHTGTTHPALLPVGQGAWHKIVLKAGPDAAALSNGIGLWLRKGSDGDSSPQTGFTLKVIGANEALEDLTVPADGKITLAANSANWQRLTSPDGLTLFMSRNESVTDIHDLSLQLIKKHEWYAEDAVRIASIDVLPMDLDVNGDGDITDSWDGLATYMPGYELDQAKLHTGGSFKDAQYAGPQDMNIVMALPSGVADQATVRIVSASERFGYCGNGTIPNDSPILPFKDFTLTGQETVAATQEATVPITGNQMIIPVYCHDYGAWCEVEITLKKNGVSVGGPISLTLPRDDNRDTLADVWQRGEVNKWNQQFHLSQGDPDWIDPENSSAWAPVFGHDGAEDAELADSDGGSNAGPMPAMADKGDGLKAHEEYRGFILDGGPDITSTKHRRLSAARKELLVECKEMVGTPFAQGYSLAGTMGAVRDFFGNDGPAAGKPGYFVGAMLDTYWVRDVLNDTGTYVTYADGTSRLAYKHTGTYTDQRSGNNMTGTLCIGLDYKLRFEDRDQCEAIYGRSSAGLGVLAHDGNLNLQCEDFVKLVMRGKKGEVMGTGAIRAPTDGSALEVDQRQEPEPDRYIYQGAAIWVNSIAEQQQAPGSTPFADELDFAVAHELGHMIIIATADGEHFGGSNNLMNFPVGLSNTLFIEDEIEHINLPQRASVRP